MPVDSQVSRRTHRFRGSILLLAVGLAALASSLLVSAWPLAITTLGLVTAAWARRSGWWAAPAYATVTLLSAIGFLWPLLSHAPWPFTTSLMLLGLVVCGICLVVLARRTPCIPSVSGIATVAAALAMPVVALASVAVTADGNRGSTWTLVRDHLIRVFDTRAMVRDGGFDSAASHLQDPLTPEILSIFAGPGHGAAPGPDLLRFEAAAQGWVVLGLLAWCSCLIACLVASAVPPHRAVLRAVLALGAGVLPWTWFIGGAVLIYGFINALVALLVLVSAWTIWMQLRRDPAVAVALLLLATFCAGISWAPVALVPWLLTLAAVGRVRRTVTGRRMIAWGVVGGACLVYVALVTLSGSTGEAVRSGDLLAVDGEFMKYPLAVALVVPVAAVVAGALARRVDGPTQLVGTVLVVAGGGVGVAYLMAQRVEAGDAAWGYYPQKLAWIVSMLCLVIGVRALTGLLLASITTQREAVAVPIIVGMVTTAAMMTASPWSARVVPTSWGGAGAFFTWTSLTDGTGASGTDSLNEVDRIAGTLFEITAPGRRAVLSDALEDKRLENYANYVVLRQQEYAHRRSGMPDVGNGDLRDLAVLCRHLRAWGPGVEVLTHDVLMSTRLQWRCGDAAPRVVLWR